MGLQEVDKGRIRSSFRNQAALVARQSRLPSSSTVLLSVPDPTVVTATPCSPVDRSVTSSSCSSCARAPPTPRSNPGSDRAPDARVTVAVTHLQNHPAHLEGPGAGSAAPAARTTHCRDPRPRPRILLGDFNLGPAKAVPILDAAGFRTVADRRRFRPTRRGSPSTTSRSTAWHPRLRRRPHPHQ